MRTIQRNQNAGAPLRTGLLCRGVLPGGTTDFNRALAVENLAAGRRTSSVPGRRLVLARVIQSAEDLDFLAQAFPGGTLAVCRVTAPRSTIVDRIRRRGGGVGCSSGSTGPAIAYNLVVRGGLKTATAETDTGSAPMRGMPVIGS